MYMAPACAGCINLPAGFKGKARLCQILEKCNTMHQSISLHPGPCSQISSQGQQAACVCIWHALLPGQGLLTRR